MGIEGEDLAPSESRDRGAQKAKNKPHQRVAKGEILSRPGREGMSILLDDQNRGKIAY